ncbi:hypothetical protein Tco_1225100, partial [Tanacetum coccineum]
MKRLTKGYSGQEVALFPTMLDASEPSTSPSRITSSPSHSPEPLPSPAPSFEHSPEHTTAAPTQPSPTQPSTRAEHHFPTPHESPLHAVYSHGSDEGSFKLNELTNLVTTLTERIGVLEDDLRKTKKSYSSAFTKLILRIKKLESQIKTGKARRKARIKASTETEPVIQEVTPTEVIQDQGSSKKGGVEVSTAVATKGTASAVLWDTEERQRAMSEAKSTKKIDWNDPSVIRYHALKMKPKTVAQAKRNMIKYLKNQGNYKISNFKGMSYNEIRPIFEKVWDFNQHIEPMDMEHGSEKMKSLEKIEEEEVDTQKEKKEVV